ncbi:MAG: hypothetical protein ABR519_01130 [Bacteroidales bacterium]
MNKIVRLTILPILLMLLAGSTNAFSQCKGFAKNICKDELGNFTHDGNYHAAILTEGEEAELYKTFYSDQEYRVAICGSDNLPPIEFKIMDASKNVIYSNADSGYERIWDFKLESSQQLKLVLKVNTFEQVSDTPSSGCVAIMFGFKIK